MGKRFEDIKWARCSLAVCALAAVSACGNGNERTTVPDAAPQTAKMAVSAPRPGSAMNPDCVPRYQASAPRTIGSPIVRTGQAGISPPVSSLPAKEKGPPAETHVVPLHRLRPWSERCPPPSTAPASHTH